MFNKKFKDKYPDVRKPVICNGLKEIKPYHLDKCHKPTPEPEPERHPVFEPEPEPAPTIPELF